MRGLAGKVAIVTGGATMIGHAVVRELRGHGTAVTIADVDTPHGQPLAAELGERALFIPTDITDDGQVEACVEATIEHFGRLDLVVNLACSYLDEALASPRRDWLSSLDVNVVSTAMMTRAAHRHLVAQGGGVIVNFASISAKVAQTGRWLYPVSKAALVQLTRNMAMDLAPDNIRVNSVSPGWTWSRVMDELSGGDRAKTDRVGGPFHLLRRVGDPEEVAQVVAFLCSDHASFVTGADWAVDGGYSAMGPEQAAPAIQKLME